MCASLFGPFSVTRDPRNEKSILTPAALHTCREREKNGGWEQRTCMAARARHAYKYARSAGVKCAPPRRETIECTVCVKDKRGCAVYIERSGHERAKCSRVKSPES